MPGRSPSVASRTMICMMAPVLGKRPVRPHLPKQVKEPNLAPSPASISSEAFSDRLLRALSQKFYECLGRDDRRKEVVDALHGRGFLFRLLAAAGVADHDRQITVVARGPGVSFDAPVEMDAGQDDDLDRFARKLQRQLRADKGGLQRHFDELVVAGANERLQ